MGVLKLVGYLIVAVAVLTALAMGALFVIVIGIAGGLLLDLAGATIFTASALKMYFNSEKKRSDLD